MLSKPIETTMKCGTTVRITPRGLYLWVEIDGRNLDNGRPIITTEPADCAADAHPRHDYVGFAISREALPGVLAMIRRAFPSRKQTAK